MKHYRFVKIFRIHTLFLYRQIFFRVHYVVGNELEPEIVAIKHDSGRRRYP